MVCAGWTALSGTCAPAVEFQFAGAVREIEDYAVDLLNVGVLELIIVPDKSGGKAHASLAKLRIA